MYYCLDLHCGDYQEYIAVPTKGNRAYIYAHICIWIDIYVQALKFNVEHMVGAFTSGNI
jgi:hypothetical protein